MNSFLKENYQEIGLLTIVDFICKHFVGISDSACKSYIGFYSPIIVKSLLDHYITGNYICNKNFLCDHDHIKFLEADDYAKKILGGN